MFQVDDYRWLSSQVGLRCWQELVQGSDRKSASLLKKLRLHLPASHASLLLEQVELVTFAKRKVPDPEQWFWTRQLLEQSSDYETAMETARDFPNGAQVLDICSGAGADAVALASCGLSVTALDRCPIACELTRHNTISHSQPIDVLERSAEEFQVDSDYYVHLDPDRRADGSRTSSLEWLSPTWETILRLLQQCQGMSIKLAPGTRVDWKGLKHRTERAPQSVRFLSRDGSVRQQRWVWGLDRWPDHSITASMHLNEPSARRAKLFEASHESDERTRSKDWYHETFLQSQTSSIERKFTIAPRDFVADYDPAIRAAELSQCFADRYGWQLIDSSSGYLTSSKPSTHPMVRWFKVVDILPLDTKRMKTYARNAKVRTWELKSRGLEVNLNSLRKTLPCDSTSMQNMTVLCTKLGDHHRAIFCTECD